MRKMTPVTVMAFVIWAVIALLIATFYAYCALSTRVPLDETAYKAVSQAVSQLRRLLFLLLALLLLISFALSMPYLPYPRKTLPDKVIFVTAKQFRFAITEKPVRTDEEFEEATPAEPIPAGALVEFRVTSLDVNHGFGLYAPDGTLLGQTQAMPGYVNRLFARLDRPGTYLVLCLEYCGLSHHEMSGFFEVIARRGGE